MNYNSDKGRSGGSWVANAVKNNPEGLLLLAAGAALLMRRSSTAVSSRPGTGNDYEFHGERGSWVPNGVSRAAQTARDYAADVGRTVSDRTAEYASSVTEYADETRRSVVDQSSRYVGQAQSALEGTLDQIVDRQPLAIALVGLAVGAAAAALLPPTRLERRTLGHAGEQLAEVANKTGQAITDAAYAAGRKLVDAADERGLNAEGLKEMAGEVADTFENSISEGMGATTTASEQKLGVADRSSVALRNPPAGPPRSRPGPGPRSVPLKS